MNWRNWRGAAQEAGKSLLLKTHGGWSKVIPGFFFPYRFAGGRIFLDITGSRMMLARALARYEKAKHAAVARFLPVGGCLIDVGVNKGDFALVGARLAGSEGLVLAFEPDPENCRWIRKSIDRNGYNNIDLREMALSDRNGSAEL